MATRTYLQTMAEINRLNAQAEKLRKAEVAGVIGRMKEAIRAYGITAADLGLEGAAPAKKAATAGATLSPLKQAMASASQTARPGRDKAPKYRDPASGKTWNGWGKPPTWIAGKDRAGFAIEGSGPAPATIKGSTVDTKAARKTRAPRKAVKAAPLSPDTPVV